MTGRLWARGNDALVALYFFAVTMTYAWPVMAGRSSNAVPGMQPHLWPWRGEADRSAALALQRDGAVSSYPWSVSYHHALRRFDLPFWDWHSFSGGYDLASDGVSGAMYPIHWLIWVAFEPPLGHDIFIILHLWLGGLVMFYLLRHWSLPRVPSLVGGTVWMLSGFNVGWLQAEMITPVLIVTPLVFWGVSAAMERNSWQRILAASGALALGLVAGNIVVFLVTIWAAGLYATVRLIARGVKTRDPRGIFTDLRTLTLVALGALALSAYSTFPTIANLTSLGRTTASLRDSMPPQAPVTSFLSSLWSSPALDWPIALFALNWCGRIALVLAVIGAFQRGRGRILALTLAIFFTLLAGTPLFVHLGWYLIPPLRAVSGLGRLTFLATFGIAILAAHGTARIVACADVVGARTGSTFLMRKPVGKVVGLAIATLVIIELVPFALAINPAWVPRKEEAFFPATRAHTALSRSAAAGSWPGLTLPLTPPTIEPVSEAWMGSSFWGATSQVGQIDSVGGYDSAVPLRAAAVTRVIQGSPPSEAVKRFGGAFLPSFSLTSSRLDLMRRFGVTHVYAPPSGHLEDSLYAGNLPAMRLIHDGRDGRVWKLVDPMRDPRLVSGVDVVESSEEALTAFTAVEHKPESTVVLEHQQIDASAIQDRPPDTSPVGTVRFSTRGSNTATVVVDASRPGWLVVPIGFSSGWSARLDGKPLSLRPADYAFTAAHVPEGSHAITFNYRPSGFFPGLAVTLVTLAMVAGFAVARARGRQARVRSSLRVPSGGELANQD